MASAASIMAAEAVPTVVAEAMALPADAAGQAQMLSAMVIVPSGQPTQFVLSMALAMPVATTNRAARSGNGALVRARRGQLVEVDAGALGPMRTLRKDRRFVVLASKWRCSYCKAFHSRNDERASEKCTECGAPRRGTTEAAVNGKEEARYEARKRSSVGRRLKLRLGVRAACRSRADPAAPELLRPTDTRKR
mgnify:CR=1 FL=1